MSHDLTSTYEPTPKIRGDGPPLVLVPGMDGTGELFYRQTPSLAESHRVATYRLREDPASMRELINDLAQVITTLAPDGQPATVVGESFGGALAMSFALERPDLVAELVILNSFPYFAPQLRLRLAIAGLTLLPWGAMRLVRRGTAFRLHSKYTQRPEIRRFLEHSRGITKRGYLSRLRILRQYDVRDRLGEIPAPTLFLAADCDNLVPSVQQSTFMAARVPDASLRILAGHGHICLIAPNLELAGLLREWRRERSRASGLGAHSAAQ